MGLEMRLTKKGTAVLTLMVLLKVTLGAFQSTCKFIPPHLTGKLFTVTDTASETTDAVKLEHVEFMVPMTSDNPTSNLKTSSSSSNNRVASVGIHQHVHEPVILLHGLLGSKRNFASIGKALAKQLRKKRRILAVDLRNHGDNHHDWRDEMDYPSMAHDLLTLLDDLDISKAVLVGHSMGGKVAKALALLHPDRVEGLVIIDIAPVDYTHEETAWRPVTNVIDALQDLTLTPQTTKTQVDQQLRKSIPDPALRAFVITNLHNHPTDKHLAWKINIDAISRNINTIAGFTLPQTTPRHQLKYQGDTFIIHGGASRFVRSKYMPIIANYFPNHMLTTIRGAGHWVHAEAPDDTIALLKKYLDR